MVQSPVDYSSPPYLSWDNENEIFIVQRDFTVSWYKIPKTNKKPVRLHKKFVVTRGFTTDLASIPQLLRSFIPQVGRHIQPSIVHDFCYNKYTGLSRAESDLLFLQGMELMKVSEPKREIIYSAVRWMGAPSWHHTPDKTDTEDWDIA